VALGGQRIGATESDGIFAAAMCSVRITFDFDDGGAFYKAIQECHG
jgi:hypothetical protein